MKVLTTKMFIVFAVLVVVSCNHSKTAIKKLDNASIEEIITAQLNGESQLDSENEVKLLNHKILQLEYKPQLLYKDSLDNLIISDVKYPAKEDEGQYDLYTLSFCIKGEDTLIVDGVPFPASDLSKIMKSNFTDMQNGVYPVKRRIDSLSVVGQIEVPEVILHVNANIEQSNGLNRKEWELLFDVVSVYVSIMNKSREDAALSHLGHSFGQLDKTNKEALKLLYSKIIAISFDQPCSYVPHLQPDLFDIEQQ
ncbi:hypothetical protein EYV94_22885 [Puteibacter caeruleilacunae]|nr:hypothetical protein EYV94_22885 [Puteibacter caeruleilacunae]